MKALLGFLFLSSVAFASCKKEDSDVCYSCKDAAQTELMEVCGSNETEAYNKVQGTTINGQVIDTRAKFLTNCPKKP